MSLNLKHSSTAFLAFLCLTTIGMYFFYPKAFHHVETMEIEKDANAPQVEANALPVMDTISHDDKTRKVQIVFALDATGSMSGLIATAKEKIWSIASSFTQSKTNTKVELGLVFYRDRGDDFITKHIALSDNLDDVYEQLMEITADGGGDAPESVNQGLYEAVTKMQWSTDSTTFKSIFLVGDCPPHTDYRKDIPYQRSCKLAQEKEITLNTILMGDDKTAKSIWKEIAQCSQGDFIQVDMNANNLAMDTPYDEGIAKLSSRKDETRIYYGSSKSKQKQISKSLQSVKLKNGISKSTAARRAEYNNATASGKEVYIGSNELVNDYKSKHVELKNVKNEYLPDNMMKMNLAQKTIYVENLVLLRDSIDKAMVVLLEKRKEYIDKELTKKDAAEVENSFDNKVYENVKKQAAKKRINLADKVKY
jgi:Mg-chelatase subunit ChlD